MIKKLVSKIQEFNENEEFISEHKICYFIPDDGKCFKEKISNTKLLIQSGENMGKGACIETDEEEFYNKFEEIDIEEQEKLEEHNFNEGDTAQ